MLALDADDVVATALEGRLGQLFGLRVWPGGRYPAVDRKQLVEQVLTAVLLIESPAGPSSCAFFAHRGRAHSVAWAGPRANLAALDGRESLEEVRRLRAGRGLSNSAAPAFTTGC